MKSDNKDNDIKLTALSERLLVGEKSPLEKDFDFEVFLDELNDQYTLMMLDKTQTNQR